MFAAGANPAVRWEWEKVARELAQRGQRVLMPNLHSDPEVKPGSGDGSRLAKVLDLLVKQLRNETGRPDAEAHYSKQAQPSTADITVMGKSWGGGQALRYTAHRPGIVSQLVLVAPMGRDSPADWRGRAPAASIPALLLYAKDDATFAGVREVKRRVLAGVLPKLQVHQVEKGGHAVKPEYAPVIASFLGLK